jgi:GMP synthase-like glutamine amidotransferase
MRVLVFQHTPEEVPGSLIPWFQSNSIQPTIFHTYEGKAFPEESDFDWLIVLGGPMNVDQTAEHPWLLEEKKFIQTWLQSSKSYLGICLGGQLLAQVLGAKVKKSNHREIGFHRIEKSSSHHPFFSDWPSSLKVFQWHEDQFSLPAGCISHFQSSACEFQAFSKGNNVIGLQFHPEAEIPWILGNYEGFSPRPNEPFEQTEQECRKNFVEIEVMQKNFFSLLDHFLRITTLGVVETGFSET